VLHVRFIVFELHSNRPKQSQIVIKPLHLGGARRWKLELIETHNPQWRDLWLELTDQDQ